MRKLSVFFMGITASFLITLNGLPISKYTAKADLPTQVYVGGMSAGFTLQSGNVQVVGLCEVMTESGVLAPALKAGIRSGDKIIKVAGIRVKTIEELNDIIHKNSNKTIEIVFQRGDCEQSLSLTAVKDKISGRYKIGILARDSISGIGTVTYINAENGRFGSLGHSVINESKERLQISKGTVYECNIVGVNKGIRGKAGELKGMFMGDQTLGTAEKVCESGIFGQISQSFTVSELMKTVADSNDVIPGKAYIYSTVNGVSPKKYEIEIVKVDKYNKDHKNYVLKIVDRELIAETGGIVQGMSGSPILQDGKLIGAVTHVFLNDPTRGYGIDIQTMLKE